MKALEYVVDCFCFAFLSTESLRCILLNLRCILSCFSLKTYGQNIFEKEENKSREM